MVIAAAPSSQWIACSAARNGRFARPLNQVVSPRGGQAVTVETPSKVRKPGRIVGLVAPVSAQATASHQTVHPELAAAQSPWPASSQFFARWDEFARFANFWEGHILAGLLRNEDVPAKVIFVWPSFDAGYSAVLVPRALMHRARWVLSWPVASDAELTFLATGELESSQE